jgi:predicted PolB exonuclease-like 3'-5' exonuclease
VSGWPVLVFDIETIPDIAGLRRLRGADPSATDDEVLATELAERAAAGKSDFMPHALQRVLVIGCAYRDAQGLRVHSFVDREPEGRSEEGRVIQQFFSTIEKRVPQLVSWNGGGFDLPVLHYRGLVHGVVASKYWDLGEGGDHDSREFKWNNYISDVPAARQHEPRHPGPAVRFSGQARHGRLRRARRLPGGSAGGHPPLLRNRRDQYLPDVHPLPDDARRPHARRT